MAKFTKTISDLKQILRETGFEGVWSEQGSNRYQFKTDDGAIMNWWSSKGTINFQGNEEARKRLEDGVTAILSSGVKTTPTAISSGQKYRQRIFVVHGHDTNSRDQLELALRRLGLEPFILMNTSGEGKTIIEALEGQIGKDFSSAFGIALMTPDDVGFAKKDGPEKEEPRARQNVILETGMLLFSTRSRMALVVKGHVELPSDLQGIIRFGFNEHIREILPKLTGRFKEAKISFDETKLSEAMA